MRRHLAARTGRYLLTCIAVLLVHFSLPRMMPGDPIVHIIGAEDYYRYPKLAARLQEKFGIDQPLHVQFARYVQMLARADLGHSFHYNRPVTETVMRRLKWTLVLVLPALALGAAAAAVLGAVAGWHRGRAWERLLTVGCLLLKSVPQYGVAILALVFLSYELRLFPLGGIGSTAAGGLRDALGTAWHAALPVLVLSVFNIAQYYMVLRNDVADIKNRPFIVTARSRGLSERAVLWRHAVRNALPPFTTMLGLGLGFSVSGALLVEIVFSWPGMGTLILTAVDNRDYPLLQACLLVLTLSVLVANYCVDLINGLCDPRVRQSRGESP